MKKPRTYWETFKGSYQMGAQKHRIFLLDLLKNKGITSILDVGCGTGPIYEMIAQNDAWTFDYKGTDYSFAMIESAKEMFSEGSFDIQDARQLREADDSWDCVLLMHALDHLDDYKSAIKEAKRVAKKYVCIVLWRSFVKEGTHLNSVNRMHKEASEEPWEDTHLQEYSKETLEEEFKKNNLTVEFETGGEDINETGRTNYLFLLKK